MNRVAIVAPLLLLAMAIPAGAVGYSYLNFGIGLMNQGRYTDAIAWFDKAIAAGDLVPDQMHVAHLDRGQAYDFTGHPDKAIGDYTAALDIRGGDPQVIAARAQAYARTDQPEKALADISALQKQRPDDVLIGFDRGLVEWQMRRYAAAADSFGKIAELGQPYAWLWMQLSNIRLGRDITPFHAPQSEIAGLHIRAQGQFGWPQQLIDYFQGQAKESDVLAQLQQEGATDGMVCEANFYLAEWRIVHGDTAGGAPLLDKAAADCPKDFVEYRMALLEKGAPP